MWDGKKPSLVNGFINWYCAILIHYPFKIMIIVADGRLSHILNQTKLHVVSESTHGM